MQTKNLVKIIKAEAAILTDLIDNLPDDGMVQSFEVDLLQSKISALGKLVDMMTNQPLEKQPESGINRPDEKTVQVKDSAIDIKPQTKPEVIIMEPVAVKEPLIAKPQAEKAADAPVKPEPVVQEEPITIPEKTIGLISNIGEVHSTEHNQIVAEKITEPEVTMESTDSSAEPLPVFVKTKIEPSNKKPVDVQSTIGERFQSESPSVNDMLAGVKRKHDVASKFHQQPITDLKKSIKLNDRIRFINELFNKDSELFEQVITEINSAARLDIALAKLFQRFSWDQENPTVVHFLELVFRRFQNQ